MDEHLGERLSAYVDGALDEAAFQEIELHLHDCAACRGQERELRALLAEAQAVLINWLTVRPLSAIFCFTAVTSASDGMVPAGIGSCQIRSSSGTSGPR